MKSVRSLAEYNAVVIGVPVYSGKVTGEVAAFVTANKDGLSRLPVAGFVTGIAPVYPKTGDVKVFTDRACHGISSHKSGRGDDVCRLS